MENKIKRLRKNVKDMNIERILIIKILLEVYDREIVRQPFLHRFSNCSKCRSLFKQRTKMILELKKEMDKGDLK